MSLTLIPNASKAPDKRDFVLESSEVLLLTKLTAVVQVSGTEAAAVANFAVSV